MKENMAIKKKRKNQSAGQMILLIVCAAVGGVAGFFGGDYLAKIDADWRETILIFIGAIAVFYLQIIMHEVGHLIFGLLSGYKFVSFRIGSLILYKREGKLHFGKYSLVGTAGQCLMAPPETEDGKIPYKLYNLGGVLMNLILTGIAAILYFFANFNVILGSLYGVCIIVGVLFALTNGIPMRLGGIDNDGYNALSLGKKPEALRAFWLQLKVHACLTEGIHLKDMPEEWFAKPSEEDMKNSMIAAVEAMRCNRVLDTMAFEEAGRAIGEVLHSDTGMVGVQQMLLQVDRVFCEILGERKEEVLQQMQDKQLKRFMNAMKTFPSVARTRYAYALLIEKNEKQARKWKKQFEKSVKKHPCKGEADSEWQFIGCCEAELEANTK